MSKWFFTNRSTLALIALILINSCFSANLSRAAQATLTWDPNDPSPDGYLIYHRKNGQAYDYSQPCWTGSGTSGTVTGLEDDTTYHFVVRAFVGTQESADSNEVTFINDTSSISMWMEAEDGDIQWPMEIAGETSASAGGFVWVPEGTGNIYNPSNSTGLSVYHFTVPEAGEYVIWGRQVSNGTNSDSFFVSVDGQPDLTWHTKLGGWDVWTWDVVSHRTEDDPRDTTQPQTYWLAVGSHSLTIKQRDDGTKLDTIVITNDLQLVNGQPTFIPRCECDLDQDGDCDMTDWFLFGPDWGRTDCKEPGVDSCECDLDHDGDCDTADYFIFVEDWGRADCPIP